jgi:hypothetical protein
VRAPSRNLRKGEDKVLKMFGTWINQGGRWKEEGQPGGELQNQSSEAGKGND